MDPAVIDALEAKARALRKQLDHLLSRHAQKALSFPQRMKIFELRERLHCIYVKLIHPERQVLYHVDVGKFHLSKATDPKMLMDRLNARGYTWELDLQK